MVLTFKDLQDRVMRMLDETATGSPTTLALVKDFLNSAHQRRCNEFPWTWMMWPTEARFTVTSTQRVYALHEEFGKPLYFINRTTKQYLEEIPMRGLPEDNRDWENTLGDASHFFFTGLQPVTKQLTGGFTVSIVSSSVSDTTAGKAITIYGENSSGFAVSESLTPNGTTLVTGTTTFTAITGVVKGAAWVGTMTMTWGGETVLSLLPAQLGKQYRTVHICELPSTSQTIGYRFFRQVRLMENDNDIPLLPDGHADLLVWDALMQMASYLTEANPQSVSLWAAMQTAGEKALYLATANEGQSLEARPHYVRYMDAQWDDPRFS